MYLGDKDQLSLPILVIYDERSKRVFTHCVPAKG
jgi:hypothetical protein